MSKERFTLHEVKTRGTDTVLVVKSRDKFDNHTLEMWRRYDLITQVDLIAPDTAEVVIPQGARTEVSQRSFVEYFNNLDT